MFTPRRSQSEKDLASKIIDANGGLYAPAKKGTSFAENRGELILKSAARSLGMETEGADDILETSSLLRP